MKISEDVKNALKRATVLSNRVIVPLKRGERVLFYKVDRIIQLTGGKWNRSEQAHIFETSDAREKITAAILAGAVHDPHREAEFFETPAKLADRLVKLASVEKHHSVLEPSAGGGAICTALERVGIPRKRICVCELREDLRAGLKSKGYEVLAGDFLTFETERRFDRAILNPPFKVDIQHVKKAFTMLGPNGVMAAIISTGWLSKKTHPHVSFRRWFAELKSSGQARVLKIPSRTFLASGSEAEAMIVVLKASD